MKQLICDSLNGMRITQTILAPTLHISDRDASPLESTVAGAQVLESNPWASFAVDCRETV